MPVSKPSKKAQILSVREVHKASRRVRSSRGAAAAAATSASEEEGSGDEVPARTVEESDDARASSADEEDDGDVDDGREGEEDDGQDDEDDEDEEEVVTPKRKRGAKSSVESSGSTTRKKKQKTASASRTRPDLTNSTGHGKVLICPETLPFLRDLASHTNDRDWFVANKHRWQDVKSEFEIFVDFLKDRARRMDPGLPDAPAKSCIFRINRDVRFAGGPLYKTSVSCSFPKKNFPPDHPACFYFRVEPGGKSRIGGGMYDVSAGKLAAVRAAIDADNGAAVKAVVERQSFREMFGDEPFQWNESLKTAPKGYKKDHEAIELLRLKTFGVKRDVDDDVVASEGFMDLIMETWTELLPWIQLLNTYAS
ncbi:hypothetical protein HK101_007557 [Irineochytrium annulatum]|nr:hypothetical protein HK101_007557 [Irineochytrium annulatum]